MNTRRVKDIVATIRDKVRLLPEDPKTTNILVRMESMVAFNALNDVLDQLQNTNEIANTESLVSLIAFLGERWSRIQSTDATYPLTPKSCANVACIVVAIELSEVTGIPIYDLLMSTVGVKNYKTSKGDLSNLSLQEFIFADDGTPIDIRQSLDEFKQFVANAKGADSHNYRLLHTCRIDNQKRELSNAERERVYNHSVEAHEYYFAVIKRENIDEKQQAFYKAIASDAYCIKSTYGWMGEQRLANKLLDNVSSQEQLIKTLKVIPKADWRDCLGAMRINDLTKLMLNDVTLVESVQKKSNYKKNDEEYNKALLFCFAMVYKRQREKGDKFTSSVGWFADYTNNILGGYPKDQKDMAVDVLLKFLVTDKPLSQLKEYVSISEKGKYAALMGPMFQSTLGQISNQAVLIATPGYFPESKVEPPVQAKTWMSYWV